ncbi:MAG: hypothetical protein ACXVBH_08500, partial [Flavisolibacter sp.]
SIVLSFYNGGFLAGANPVFGCSLTKWVDLGIVGNYTYSSYREYDYNAPGYYGAEHIIHQSVYGGGLFTRLFPVRFLFAQAQVEHNWLHSKYIPTPGSGGATQTATESANSILVGAGYTTPRDPVGRSPYGYLAILFDVGTDPLSPYKDAYARAIPIFRAGFNVPLFQGKGDQRR